MGSCGLPPFRAVQAYPLFINLLTTFWYIPVSLAYIIPMQKYRPDVITPEARAVPQKVWAVMGLLDSIAGVMQALALDKLTNGGLITLLLQSAIPLSMLITWIFLRTKYSRSQFVGAFIVILGLVAALIPTFTGSDSSSDANSSGNPSAAFTLAWSAVLVASCIPMCLSSVYKEKALGDTEIDAIYLNYWFVCLFCFLISPFHVPAYSPCVILHICCTPIYDACRVAVYQFVFSFPLLIPSAYASEVGGSVQCSICFFNPPRTDFHSQFALVSTVIFAGLCNSPTPSSPTSLCTRDSLCAVLYCRLACSLLLPTSLRTCGVVYSATPSATIARMPTIAASLPCTRTSTCCSTLVSTS